MMQVINLTNPGQDPSDGDTIRIIYGNGVTEQKQYTAPVEPTPPTRRDVIRTRLQEIDSITDRPRTRRELQLNKTATKEWLQTLDDEADALREELKALAPEKNKPSASKSGGGGGPLEPV